MAAFVLLMIFTVCLLLSMLINAGSVQVIYFSCGMLFATYLLIFLDMTMGAKNSDEELLP